ncbi:hypothetical protein VPH35_007923 [Triticum aestivum]
MCWFLYALSLPLQPRLPPFALPLPARSNVRASGGIAPLLAMAASAYDMFMSLDPVQRFGIVRTFANTKSLLDADRATLAGAIPFLEALPRPILRALRETPDLVPQVGRRHRHGVVPLH